MPTASSSSSVPASPNNNNTINNTSENIYCEDQEAAIPPPLPPLKPSWRLRQETGNTADDEGEEAIPSDSLYGGNNAKDKTFNKQMGSRPSLTELAHWSSHGYLAKGQTEGTNASLDKGSGYVILKHINHTMLATKSQQPASLPTSQTQSQNIQDGKYYSIKGKNICGMYLVIMIKTVVK